MGGACGEREIRLTQRTPVENLQAYFAGNGLLLCNENACLPCLWDAGGDWNAIVTLMERREAFYSKFYKGRVTYLSAALYYQLKPCRQRKERLSPEAARLYAYLEAAGAATTEQIKDALLLTQKSCSACMDELFCELLATVLRRDQTLQENWCTFVYGTFAAWERTSDANHGAPDSAVAVRLLAPYYTGRQLAALLNLPREQVEACIASKVD